MTCSAIWLIDADNSSVALATDCTLDAVWSEIDSTEAARCAAWSAVTDID
ncbi:hypothetical protein [Azospirillum palustre]